MLRILNKVVHSETTGLDELAPIGVSFAVLVKRGKPNVEMQFTSSDFGVSELKSLDSLLGKAGKIFFAVIVAIDQEVKKKGGSPQQNASRFRMLLSNPDNDPDLLDFVAMNAGAALWISDKADSVLAGTNLAKKALRDGVTKAWFENLQNLK